MTQINLGKIRMLFAGGYDAGAAYTPTDIVRDDATGHLYVPILAVVPAGTALTDAASYELMIAAPAAGATAAQGAKADAAMPKAGGDFTGPVKAVAVSETLAALAGATPNMDLSTATLFTLTTAGAVTLTHSNAPAAAWVRTLVITAGGADAITFPANWDWGDDGLPDPLATVGDVLEIAFRGEGASAVRASLSWRKTV